MERKVSKKNSDICEKKNRINPPLVNTLAETIFFIHFYSAR